jgi:hypothetical protein
MLVGTLVANAGATLVPPITLEATVHASLGTRGLAGVGLPGPSPLRLLIATVPARRAPMVVWFSPLAPRRALASPLRLGRQQQRLLPDNEPRKGCGDFHRWHIMLLLMSAMRLSLTVSVDGSCRGSMGCRVACSMARSIRRSRGETNRMASPARPARPVRPIRWM